MIAIELAPAGKIPMPEDGDAADAIPSTAKKRNKKKARKYEIGTGFPPNPMDPLWVLGTDIMLVILSHLDARSVALSLLVCRRWNGVASSDAIWGPKCEELWAGKAHIPRMSKLQGLTKLEAYSLSVMDGKRVRIVRDDLCDHAWEFHYAKDVPQYWKNMDPYWSGTGAPLRHYFHQDGSQTADEDDQTWGGHEACYCVVTSYLESAEAGSSSRIREHYVRINRLPQLYVSRKVDWKWEMSSRLCTYTSIPDSDRPSGTGPLFPVS